MGGGLAVRGPAAAAAAGLPEAAGRRDETQKHAQALQAAGQKKAKPDELCKLFKAYLAAESKLVKGLEEDGATCGVPA